MCKMCSGWSCRICDQDCIGGRTICKICKKDDICNDCQKHDICYHCIYPKELFVSEEIIRIYRQSINDNDNNDDNQKLWKLCVYRHVERYLDDLKQHWNKLEMYYDIDSDGIDLIEDIFPVNTDTNIENEGENEQKEIDEIDIKFSIVKLTKLRVAIWRNKIILNCDDSDDEVEEIKNNIIYAISILNESISSLGYSNGDEFNHSWCSEIKQLKNTYLLPVLWNLIISYSGPLRHDATL